MRELETVNKYQEVSAVIGSLCTGNICDANGKRGNMDAAIRPLDPLSRLAGFAMTVKCKPGDNLAIHRAIAAASCGIVLVIDAQGHTGAGYVGEIAATACLERKISGIVIDGACRDALAIRKLGLPVFCRGLNPGGTFKEDPGSLHEIIQCGGITVNPGDLVVGDADGVIVVQKENVAAVLEKARAIVAREAQTIAQLREGKTTMEIFDFKGK